jgi:hypothetical protein
MRALVEISGDGGRARPKKSGKDLDDPQKPGICGVNLRNDMQPVQPSLHFASLPPERRILD